MAIGPGTMGRGASRESAVQPYTYCSKDNCRVIQGEHELFFGDLPATVGQFCKDSAMYALTFDDGPTAQWDELMEILARHKVKATFFVIGQNLLDPVQRARVLKAHQSGHQISNHTTHHIDLLKQTDAAVAEELEGTRKQIVGILGPNERVDFDARVVRPPFGYIDDRVADVFAAHKFIPVRWNSDRFDWELAKDESPVYLRRLNQHLEFLSAQTGKDLNRSILDLNHDRSRATLDSLPALVSKVRQRGYRFVTVSECLGR